MIDTQQLPFVRNIMKAEKVKYADHLDRFNECQEVFKVKDTYNNPIENKNGLYCISDYRDKKIVYIFVVKNIKIIEESRNILHLKPLIQINWETWLEYGGHKIVTRPGRMKQNAIKFIPNIMEIIPAERKVYEVKKIPIIKQKKPIEENYDEIKPNDILEASEIKILKLQEQTDMFMRHLTSLNEKFKEKIFEKEKEIIQKEKRIETIEGRLENFKMKMIELIQTI